MYTIDNIIFIPRLVAILAKAQGAEIFSSRPPAPTKPRVGFVEYRVESWPRVGVDGPSLARRVTQVGITVANLAALCLTRGGSDGS